MCLTLSDRQYDVREESPPEASYQNMNQKQETNCQLDSDSSCTPNVSDSSHNDKRRKEERRRMKNIIRSYHIQRRLKEYRVHRRRELTRQSTSIFRYPPYPTLGRWIFPGDTRLRIPSIQDYGSRYLLTLDPNSRETTRTRECQRNQTQSHKMLPGTIHGMSILHRSHLSTPIDNISFRAKYWNRLSRLLRTFKNRNFQKCGAPKTAWDYARVLAASEKKFVKAKERVENLWGDSLLTEETEE
ncbi:hypothetical protein GGR52DRAFT_586114 [Hypoxylon sp. FL1284]|nr:hypothetical protein GGR52DRAFT_586114 [Hypoxylon sp. FL1284]